MNTDSVVITGIGVVTAAGVGLDAFQSSLQNSTPGVAPKTLPRENGAIDVLVGAVNDEDLPKFIHPKRHLNFKHMSRSGVMVCAAAALAIKDGQFEPSAQTIEQTGIVTGTAFGGIQSMLKFNADVRAKGPSAVNPIIFPDTVSNAPAGYAAIAFGMQGMNATLSTGFSSGLRAIRIAYEQVASGGLEAAFAGGYDELIPELCHYWQSTGAMSSDQTDGLPSSRPFDVNRNGFYPGEGAVILLLERRSTAEQRGAAIHGELLGFGSCQSNQTAESGRIGAQGCTMQRALVNAGLKPSEIAAVFASANGSVIADRDEALAIAGLFGPSTPVAAVKSFTGECMAAAGPASVSAALLALRQKKVLGIPGLANGTDNWNIRISNATVEMDDRKYCLINSFGLDGQGESLIVGL